MGSFAFKCNTVGVIFNKMMGNKKGSSFMETHFCLAHQEAENQGAVNSNELWWDVNLQRERETERGKRLSLSLTSCETRHKRESIDPMSTRLNSCENTEAALYGGWRRCPPAPAFALKLPWRGETWWRKKWKRNPPTGIKIRTGKTLSLSISVKAIPLLRAAVLAEIVLPQMLFWSIWLGV